MQYLSSSQFSAKRGASEKSQTFAVAPVYTKPSVGIERPVSLFVFPLVLKTYQVSFRHTDSIKSAPQTEPARSSASSVPVHGRIASSNPWYVAFRRSADTTNYPDVAALAQVARGWAHAW